MDHFLSLCRVLLCWTITLYRRHNYYVYYINSRDLIACMLCLCTVKTKVGRAHQLVSTSTPIALLVCCGRQNGGLYPPLFIQCGHIIMSNTVYSIILATYIVTKCLKAGKESIEWTKSIPLSPLFHRILCQYFKLEQLIGLFNSLPVKGSML